MKPTHGWGAHNTIAVIKGPALVQLPRVQALMMDVGERHSEYMLVHGKANGQLLYNGDVVMLYYDHNKKYVSIVNGDDTSLNFVPD